jgi:hypothetical protein
MEGQPPPPTTIKINDRRANASQRPHPPRRSLANLVLLLLLASAPTPAVASGPPDPGGGSGPTNIFLDSWSFWDTNAWSSDFGCQALSFTNLGVSDLGAGNALVIDSPDSAWLTYPVYDDSGSSELSLPIGTVLMWFAPNWSGTNAGIGYRLLAICNTAMIRPEARP